MEYCPETGDGDLDVDWTATPHPAAEKLQCLAPPGKSGRGKKQLLDFLLALPWWVTLPDCRPQTQLCSKDLLLNIGALQSPACSLAFPMALFWWWASNMHLHHQNADCLQNQKNHYMKTSYKIITELCSYQTPLISSSGIFQHFRANFYASVKSIPWHG